MKSGAKYIFDTNAIVNPFNSRYSFSEEYNDRTDEIEKWFLDVFHASGVLIKEVVDEVSAPQKAYELVKQAKGISGVIIEPDPYVYDTLKQLKTYIGNNYNGKHAHSFFQKPGGGDKADPWVLSFAKRYALTIVTLESRAIPLRNGADHFYEGKPLIPHIAWKIGVSVTDVYTLMHETGFLYDGLVIAT